MDENSRNSFDENQFIIYSGFSYYIMVRRQNSTTAEVDARFQRLFPDFPNPSWLTSGRTSGHQNLISIFPGIDNCLKAKC